MPAAKPRRGCAHGRANGAGHPALRHRRRDVLQSRPSAVSARAIWSAKSMRWTASWAGWRTPAASSFACSIAAKGPAVRGPRAQADRKLYAAAMQAAIRATANLTVIEGEADDLAWRGPGPGVRLADGRAFRGGAVVLTTGTFLRGLIHIGERQIPAGRVGEAPALGLSRTLERARLCAWPAEDRYAAAPRRHDDRLGGAGNAAGRRSRRSRFRC